MNLTRKRCGVAAAALLALAGCDKPGPLSAAAKGTYPAPPPAPAWAASLAGRPLREAFPNTIQCLGFVDGTSDRYRRARKAYGWAWNRTSAQPIARVAVVDADGRMIAFGEGGIPRQDVVQARPEVRTPTSGWSAVAPIGKASTIFGLDAATRAACSLGAVTP
jgi:hypothetical protein